MDGGVQMVLSALAPPGGDSGPRQLLRSGPGPGQDRGAGKATYCQAIGSAGAADARAPKQVRGGSGGDEHTLEG